MNVTSVSLHRGEPTSLPVPSHKAVPLAASQSNNTIVTQNVFYFILFWLQLKIYVWLQLKIYTRARKRHTNASRRLKIGANEQTRQPFVGASCDTPLCKRNRGILVRPPELLLKATEVPPTPSRPVTLLLLCALYPERMMFFFILFFFFFSQHGPERKLLFDRRGLCSPA